MKGSRMRDIGCHLGGWGFGGHEDPSDDHSTVLMNEDSGAESESNEADRPHSFAVPDDSEMVSVTVGLPTRFGNPASSDEDPDSQVTNEASPECMIDSNLREILRKVTVNESALRAAIECLGGGMKGLKAVLDYVKYFQESRDRDAGNVNPEAFTRGLEQFCLLYGQAKESSVSGSPNKHQNQTTEDLETRQTLHPLPNVQLRGQDEWTRSVHAGDPYTTGYVENMSGYYPNFCYPYPPPFAGYAPFNMGVPPMYMPMMGVPYFTPPSHEFVHTADAMTRASRKSRIARRRVHGSDAHQPRSTVKPAHVGAVLTGRLENMAPQNLAVASSGQGVQGLNTNDLMFLLAKQLSPSGVSSLGRIVLPKKEAEAHLPHLVASEGVLLTMADFDTRQSWTFRYRFWSNNKSRMYLLENTRDFVKAHNLQERDMLVLYRDAEGSYVVRGEKNGANQTSGDAAGGIPSEVTFTEEGISRKKQKV